MTITAAFDLHTDRIHSIVVVPGTMICSFRNLSSGDYFSKYPVIRFFILKIPNNSSSCMICWSLNSYNFAFRIPLINLESLPPVLEL